VAWRAYSNHAVSGAGTFTFGYDCNGNMIARTDSSGSFTQQWDKENMTLVYCGLPALPV
jgi:YD repeat-containing protein